MISVVLFDLDDTLFAHRQAVEEGVLEHLRALDLPVRLDDATEVARWNHLEELHYSRYLSGEIEYLGQRRERARDFMEPYGVTFADGAAAERWFDVYLEQYRAAWTLFDDTLPLLGSLTTRLGIITNGDLDFQLAKLDAVGLARYFDHVVTSGEFGVVKPDPRIFQHACALFGVAPSKAVYVGDRLHTDAIGASAAGLTGVWLDRRGAATPHQLAEAADAAVPVLASLGELPAILESLP